MSATRKKRKKVNEMESSVQIPSTGIVCPKCELRWKAEHAGENKVRRYEECVNFKSREALERHLDVEHGVQLERVELTFDSYEAFREWKKRVERETTSKFVFARRIYVDDQKLAYREWHGCNRSGFSPLVMGKTIKKRMNEAKSRKAKPLERYRKIGSTCPASILLTGGCGGCSVTFVKTHLGHECDARHLHLPEELRQHFIGQLREGRTVKQVLGDYKQLESPTRRPVTYMDIYNLRHNYVDMVKPWQTNKDKDREEARRELLAAHEQLGQRFRNLVSSCSLDEDSHLRVKSFLEATEEALGNLEKGVIEDG